MLLRAVSPKKKIATNLAVRHLYSSFSLIFLGFLHIFLATKCKFSLSLSLSLSLSHIFLTKRLSKSPSPWVPCLNFSKKFRLPFDLVGKKEKNLVKLRDRGSLEE